ncbi:dihydroflavonol-4-reductase [Bathymodiolus japonicus methanotrophic gill symbiont]|uniref:SDR family oxidoreductase n=1 Tax=Bathymodiolus japonicus methanotrophic gill symbiont TaxID=113269 RepID=UPI001B4D101E|nr:SDR family oxidoreductase [Bathymodiolus japonicus methanotrophic gill symbiont]GFO72982.1 dihydroflavonol-4-reductase [Bathymodiolus japonicus methanotrophic gill symbiont]
MTTLVTGASGHLGANLVRTLLDRGEQVRVLIRKGSNNTALDGLNVEYAYGDLRDEPSIINAVKNCDYVYHLAAFVSIRDGERDELYDVNVLGTRYLMQACRHADVKRVVHCSSFGAVGNNPDGASNEKWAVSPYEMTTDYEISKTFAELEVYKEVVRGLQAVIVNPSGIVGPWDFKPSLLGKTIIEFAQGKMRASVPGGFDFTPVQDVVQGHLLAMEKGIIGERYLLTGEQHSLSETLGWLEEFTGVKKPKLVIPTFIMQKIAVVKDWIERKFFPHVYPRFNYHSIRLLNCGKYGTHTRAINELGLQPTPVKEAYRDSVLWFREHGYIE